MQEFIQQLPKVELHLHIEGTLEPELLFALAQRNQVALPYSTIDELKQAYRFNNLQQFLDLYYQGAQVLQHEQDFYDLTWAYFQRCAEQNIRHTEIFFDPQTHTVRGVDIETVIMGIHRAQQQAASEYQISSELILCFLRHLSEKDALETLKQALPYRNYFVGVGLDSSELGHPPEKFIQVFAQAKAEGLRLVAHAGEEGPASYIWSALNQLAIERVDHGVACVQDLKLIHHLIEKQIPLTICPLSNTALQVYQKMEQHPVIQLLNQGMMVTINSDDPAYFGGYMNENFFALTATLQLSQNQAIQLTKNAINASFANTLRKQALLQELQEFTEQWTVV